MKKTAVLAAILTVVFGSLTCLYAQELESPAERSLGEFDGLRHDIRGPMNTPVPARFFTEKTSFYLGDKEYHTVFEVDIKKVKKSVLVLKNALEDGKPYPVVISVGFSENCFRNYIVTFGEESVLIISLSEELELQNAALKKTECLKDKTDSICLVNVISSFPFTGEIRKNAETVVLEVSEPETQEEEFDILKLLSGDNFYECCPDSNYSIPVFILCNTTGESWYAWIDIDRVATSNPYRYVGELRCYYPLQNTLYHYPDPVMRQFEIPSCFYDGYSCQQAMLNYYTVGTTYGEGLRWYYMDEVLSDDGCCGTAMDWGYDPNPPVHVYTIIRASQS